jgi:amino acid permease
MLDILGAMRKPEQFSKSVWASQLFMLFNYATVGMLGFHVYGNNVMAPITLNLPKDTLGSFTNALLFLHVVGQKVAFDLLFF